MESQPGSIWHENEKRIKTILLLVTLVGLALRIAVFFLFNERVGDGPSRAIQAYMWAESPVLRPHAVWPPFYVYLTGLFNMAVNDPLISTRIFNLILGALTIPTLYALMQRVFNNLTAILCAIFTAFFPFHIGLSVTSLTEISFLIAIMAGLLCVIKAAWTNGGKRLIYILLTMLFCAIASLTRYEAWILLPLFPAYFLLKTGKFYQTIILAIGIAIFPVAWMALCYIDSGALLPAYGAAMQFTEGGTNLIGALKMLANISKIYLGLILPVLAIAGFVLLLVDGAKRQLSKERLLYLLIVCITGIFMVKFTMDRGDSLRLRYLLVIFIMILPISCFVLQRYFGKKTLVVLVAVLLSAAPPFLSQVYNKKQLYVTSKADHSAEHLASWIEKSAFKKSSILMTEMGWKSTLIPLHIPEIAFRYIIVSDWLRDSLLSDFIAEFQPQLLITSDDQQIFNTRIEKALGAKIAEASLIYDKDSFKVYDIRGLLQKNLTPRANKKCIPVGPDFLDNKCQTHLF
jgi:hypothetical protein